MSDSKSEQKTQTTSNVVQVDRRTAAAEGSVVATEGGTATVVNQDISPEVIDVATRANVAVSQSAIGAAENSSRFVATVAGQSISAQNEAARLALSANASASERALDTADRALVAVTDSAANNAEAARLALSAVTTGQDRALDTADRAVASAGQNAAATLAAATQLSLANNDLTEKTREGNQELVKLVAGKLTDAVTDERQNINSELLTTLGRYGAAAVGLVALGLVLLNTKKKSA